MTMLTAAREESGGRGAARHLAPLLHTILGDDPPVRIIAWDGSETGPADAPALVLRSRKAIRQLMWRPDELGLARAYIGGLIDVEGDLGAALSAVRRALSERSVRRLPKEAIRDGFRAVLATGAIGGPPPRPSEEARLRGALHTLGRDRAAISHHYDLSNDFYTLLLDETMAYSCGYWDGLDPTGDGTAASLAKLELVCRKLGLRPGMRMVDVGCGWGSLVVHAAQHYGVDATGFTISQEQGAYVAERIAAAGLSDRARVMVRDYRDVDVRGADAVASIEMGEHVGESTYPEYTRILHDVLRPGGRLLLQQMSRHRGTAPGGGPFIESYIAPDMHMRPLPDTLAMIAGSGLEIRDVQALREHYVLTVDAWARRLEQRWPEFTGLVGERIARIWRLYLVGGSLAFAENRMGVDQILAARPADGGASSMPLGPEWIAGQRPAYG